MSKVPRPDVTASTERLQVTASYARIRLSFGAPLMVALSGIRSTAFRVGPRVGCLSSVSALDGFAIDWPSLGKTPLCICMSRVQDIMHLVRRKG